MKLIEPGPGIKKGLRDFRLNAANITAFVTAIVFTLSGAIVLFANVSAGAGLSDRQAASWLMSGFVLGPAVSVFLCLYYKQPIIMAPSLPALLVMGPMFKLFSANEMIAGYLLAGLILLLLGAFGIVGRLGKLLPIPIIMGMIAGVFMSYGFQMVDAVKTQPLVAGLTIAAFLITPNITKKVPPLSIALLTAILLTVLFLPFNTVNAAMQFKLPVFVSPEFNPRVIFSVTIPLVLLALADTLKGYGVLRANEYAPPLNTATTIAGIISILGSFSLTHAIVLTGPITAIIGGGGAGRKEHRYVAGVLTGCVMIIIGLMAGILLPFITSLPTGVSGIVAGLAMIGLFTSSLDLAFGSKKFQVGAFTAFLVGMSNVTILGIGSPVWAIFAGIGVSLLIERQHFNTKS